MIDSDATTLNNPALVKLLESMPKEERLHFFASLPLPQAVEVFDHLSFRSQGEILDELPSKQVAALLNAMSPDDRTALLEELPPASVSQLLKYLSPEARAISIKLLGYPANSVGRLMTPDYIALKLDLTVKESLDYIREKGRDSETVNVVYAVDDKGILIDDFRIRQLLFASLDTPLSALADGKFLALHVDDDEEKAIQLFRNFERTALPVIDSQGILLGIVTIDDIVQVSVQEDTEDIHKIAGILAFKEPYMEAPLFLLLKKRVSWLIILFLGELLTASTLAYFEDEIARVVVLALFLPLIISSGGNAGSQASTLIIRAMALGEITLRDWWKILRREIVSGFCLGTVLGSIGFCRIALFNQFSPIYGPHPYLIGLTVCFALIGVVLWGTLMGAMLPLILKSCGFDPAVSSAPFIATLVDVTGLIIYFTIALIVLHGTLL